MVNPDIKTNVEGTLNSFCIMGIIIGNVGYLVGNELILVLREGPAVFDMVERMLGGTRAEVHVEHRPNESRFC